MTLIPLNLTRSPAPTTGPLQDTFARRHNNLRLSVTDRCNLRCVYCMPEDVTFLNRQELLSFEELTTFAAAVLPLGIDKIRLTGGEPLMRKQLPGLIQPLLALPGLRDLAMTTNALLLAEQAEALYAAGLRRLNVSLDTLDEGRFRTLARRDGLAPTLEGLAEAQRLGFQIKINAVAVRGFIEPDIVPLAQYCRERGFELRFIEYMPIGADAWDRSKVVFAHEILDTLEQQVSALLPVPEPDPTAPALTFDYADGQGRVGVIASVSRPFCRSCNRIRLTAEGRLRNCLFAKEEVDLKPWLRPAPGSSVDVARIQQLVRETIWAKDEGHEINQASFLKPERTMHRIGG